MKHIWKTINFQRRTIVCVLLNLQNESDSRIKDSAVSRCQMYGSCYSKRENICSLLIDRGADLTYTDPRGMSYLHCAAYQDLPTVINILTAYGVDINPKVRFSFSWVINYYSVQITVLFNDFYIYLNYNNL